MSLNEQAVVMALGLSAGLSSSTGQEGSSAKLGRQKAWEGCPDLPVRVNR